MYIFIFSSLKLKLVNFQLNFDLIAALKNCHDLMMLPRIMIFISNILCEMGSSRSTVRSGPSLNSNWLHAFACIEANRIEHALGELSKERRNWTHRDDMLIRAARHYEGAMLAFIRLATSCFKLDNSQSTVELRSSIYIFIYLYTKLPHRLKARSSLNYCLINQSYCFYVRENIQLTHITLNEI